MHVKHAKHAKHVKHVKRNKVGQRNKDVQGHGKHFEMCSPYVSASAVVSSDRVV